MTDREVMQQALKAWGDPMGMKDLCVAMDALRTALGQSEQEPVALKPCRSPYCECDVGKCSHPGCFDARHEKFNPPAAQPEQVDCPRCGHVCSQRPWVGLTPEEILGLFDANNVYGSKWVEFAHSVEAKRKERNT